MEDLIILCSIVNLSVIFYCIYQLHSRVLKLERGIKKLCCVVEDYVNEDEVEEEEDEEEKEEEKEDEEEEDEVEEEEEEDFLNTLFQNTVEGVKSGKPLEDILNRSVQMIQQTQEKNPELVNQSEEFILDSLAKKGVMNITQIEQMLNAVQETKIFTPEQINMMKNRFAKMKDNLIEYGDTGDSQKLDETIGDAELAMNNFLNDEFLEKARSSLKNWMRNPADFHG